MEGVKATSYSLLDRDGDMEHRLLLCEEQESTKVGNMCMLSDSTFAASLLQAE
jgi:hypothetical protein